MRKMISLLLGCMLLSGCAAQNTAGAMLREVPLNQTESSVTFPADFQESLLGMTEELTGDVFGVSERANPIFSPLSLWFALGVLRDGASGETLKDLNRLMKVSEDFDSAVIIPSLSKSLNFMAPSRLPKISEKGGIRLSNGVFFDSRYRKDILDSWLNQAAEVWGAESAAVDFTREAETKKIIRDWVSRKTEDFIPDYEASFATDGTAILNIYNVLYLKDHWLIPFARIPDGEFHSPKGTVTVPFLGGIQEASSYYRGADYQAAAFAGERNLKVWFLLPDENHSAVELIPRISDLLSESDSYESSMVDFKAPLLDVDGGNLSLKPVLIDKGYGAMFNSAELARMLQGVSAMVDDIRQKTRLQLDEKGFQAAAVTEISIRETSMPESVKLTLDRPFLLLIEFQGLPLFVAHITDPSAK